MIHGNYSPPILNNVAWTVELHDYPKIDGSKHLTCSTSEPSVDIDTWLPLEIFIGDDDLKFVDRGPLCQALDIIGTATTQLLLPGGNKLDFAYSRMTDSGSDLIVGGKWAQVPRSPSIGAITSTPAIISVSATMSSFSASLQATLHDLRPPLTITWSRRQFLNGSWSSWKTDAGATQTFALGTPAARMLNVVTWPRPNPDHTPHTVQAFVEITDADGLSASASKQLSVKALGETGGFPVCDSKPYLPQCN